MEPVGEVSEAVVQVSVRTKNGQRAYTNARLL